jgi:hypothetical protein
VRAAYNGHEALTFGDYLDLESGNTLHAEPGGVYDVAPASGRPVPEIPEPWFTATVTDDDSEGADAPAEGDGAPDHGGEQEAGGEPAHDEGPETDASQQF